MKYIQTEQSIAVPEGVTVSIKSRVVKVTGPRGTLVKSLKHIDVTFTKVSEKLIKVTVHNGDRKHVAALRTVKSLVDNLITGVTKGYKYKLRYVYAHFPINVNTIDKDGKKFIEIRNFLGDKKVRLVPVREGVDVEFSTTQKDELVLSGNSVEDVSQNAADLQQICRVRNKDIRKFLDGIYVSHKGFIEEEL
ncbi:Ribosomal protein L6 signature 2 [Nakaseomyces glabratus]|nr:Ribosomal protein L6 signature 2 [Nakaseomyces glabratus]